MYDKKDLKKKIQTYKALIDRVKQEISKIVVGQEVVIDGLLRAVISNGHVLLEGVPGIAKTLMVKTLSKVTKCAFNRIQFTPDLLPTDIVGITAYEEKKGFFTLKGPIFNNFILADEINRAPPKVQSALLEGMQEKQVTIGKETFSLPRPFFVLATQNPIESLGTYPLPEAQIDRFLFKLNIGYPTQAEEQHILKKNITLRRFEEYKLNPIISPEEIITLQSNVKHIYLDNKIEKYIIRLVDCTRRSEQYKIKLGKYIEYGASPRASIGLFIASKADALIKGDLFVTPNHVKNVAADVLRHRIILNYEGQAEGIKTDNVIGDILSKVPIP